MGKTVAALPYPPKWINKYIFNELAQYDDIGVSAVSQLTPIFATSPTNTEEIYKNVVQATAISEPLVIIYDRLITFRPSVFYPHKREQVIYYLYSTSLANVNNANNNTNQLNKNQGIIRKMIKDRNEEFFLEENNFFDVLSDQKKNKFLKFSSIWRSKRLDKEDKETIWKWIDSFVFLTDKYNKLKEKA
jgi:hypothetical protein